MLGNLLLLCVIVGSLVLFRFLIQILRLLHVYLRGNELTRRAIRMLICIYKPWAICLREVEIFDAEKGYLKGRVHAPKDYSYTWRRPECVTGIHYHLALSELDYVFIRFLIDSGKATIISREYYDQLQKLASSITALDAQKGEHRRRKKVFLPELQQKRDWAQQEFNKLSWGGKFSPKFVLNNDYISFQDRLFWWLGWDYKLVFLKEKLAFIRRVLSRDDYCVEIQLKSSSRTSQGFPEVVLEIGKDVMLGTVNNAALIYEIKAQP